MYVYIFMARDAIKLALLGFRHPVEVWGFCPPAWDGPWLPIGVLWDSKLGPWLDAWPSGVCVGLGSRTEDLILLGPAAKVQAGFLG